MKYTHAFTNAVKSKLTEKKCSDFVSHTFKQKIAISGVLQCSTTVILYRFAWLLVCWDGILWLAFYYSMSKQKACLETRLQHIYKNPPNFDTGTKSQPLSSTVSVHNL